MHKEDADAYQRNQHQHYPRQMRFHPVHGEQRATRLHLRRLAQSGFIRDVVNCIKAGRRQQSLHHDPRRRDADVKAEHQHAGEREAEEEGQQKQQREKDVEVKAHAAKFKPGQGGDKHRRQQPDDQ